MSARILSLVLLLSLSSALCFGQGDDVPQEYLVKAKYLLNIPLFVDLPPQSAKAKSYTICLMGDTPLESPLAAARGRMIKNRPVNVLRVGDVSQVGSCQMLFIASSERHRLQTLLPEAHSRGILTVSDMRDFARMGGIINLLTVDNRLTFDLNRSAASKASISLGSQLLKLAHDVIN
jgi:hypothetical protein